MLLGFDGNRPLYFGGQGGILTVGGARSGKLQMMGYTACGIGYRGNVVALEVKGESAKIAENQAFTGRHTIDLNPFGMHDLREDRLDLFGHINLTSRNLVPDLKEQCLSISPKTAGTNSSYFEGRAQEYAEALGVTCVERNGSLTLPDWYDAVNRLIEDGERWDDFAFDMQNSQFEVARKIEKEVHNSRENGGNGFHGILGQLSDCFKACSDPQLLAAFSPPFNFSFQRLLNHDERYVVRVIIPESQLATAAMVVKAVLTTAFTIKSRDVSAPPQLWIMDEAPTLGANPILVKAHATGAGQNIRPWTICQSLDQLDVFSKNAKSIIKNSSSVTQVFGIRDEKEAEAWSARAGDETLCFDDEIAQLRARQRKQAAAVAMLQGEDFLKSAMTYGYEAKQAVVQSQVRRRIRTAEEILNMPPDRQMIFCDHVDKLVYAERRPYYQQAWMAGHFFPNPYHDRDMNSVRTKNKAFGYRRRRILECDPPKHLRHLHQYQNRPLRYVEGFKP